MPLIQFLIYHTKCAQFNFLTIEHSQFKQNKNKVLINKYLENENFYEILNIEIGVSLANLLQNVKKWLNFNIYKMN